MSKLGREERKKRKRKSKLVSYIKPGTEHHNSPTQVVSTKRRYKKALKDYEKSLKKKHKVKKSRRIRATF